MSPKPALRLAEILPGLPPNAWVAVIRLRSLGDTVLSTPALEALKSWRPDLRVAYLVEPAFVPAIAGHPAVDAIVEVPAGIRARAGALAALRRLRPQLTLSLHGGLTAAWLTRLSGARHRAGFLGLRHAWAYTTLAQPKSPPPGRPRLHTVEHVASLFEYLGMPPARLGPARVHASPEVRARVRRELTARGITGRFAFLSVNPRSFTMRWEAERFQELGRWLREECGLAVVLAHGAVESGAIEREIARQLEPQATVLTTSVEELIALEAEAALVVGGDGGPIHVAAALGIPTVAIFSSTDATVWGPWQAPARIVQNSFACNPCRADRCYAFVRPECILSVRVEQVQAAVRSLLLPA